MKKIYLLVFAVLLVSLAAASTSTTWGTHKQNSCVNIVSICPLGGCNETNITKITSPSSSILVSDAQATHNENTWNYSFCNTSELGTYNVYGLSSNGTKTIYFVGDFEVTPSGFINTLGLYLIFLIVFGGIVVLGFSIKEVWFVVIGGLGFIMLGIYSINYGVVGFRDMFMTWGLGLFEIAVGAILSIGAGIQKMKYD